jgi:tryptophan 2,3-dioxygenase
MASMIVERLRNEALNLPHAERAELACRLVQSLAGPADPATARTHRSETLCRLAEATSENTQVIDRAEFAKYMQERMEQP